VKPVVAAAALALLLAAQLGAQETGEEAPGRSLWAAAGLGPGTEGGAALIALRYSPGGHLFSARTAGSFGITEGEGRTDVGLLYGRRVVWNGPSAHASAGLAYVHHAEESGDTSGELGLPLSVGVGWAPVPWIGIGLEVFGNLNPTEHFGGIVLEVELGLIR
jgi:hypothetical protein